MKHIVLSALALFVIFTANVSYAQPEHRVGVTIYKYDDNFMKQMRKDINDEAKNLTHLKWFMNDAQNSQVKQLKQVETLLAHKMKVLAVNIVNANESKTIVEKAKVHNVPVVFFNRSPEPAALASYDKTYFVSADPKEAGKIQGELIANAWKANPSFDLNKDGKLQYVLLKGEPSDVSAIRSQAVIDELNRQGIATEEVYSDTAMWRAAVARNKMNEWLVSNRANEIEIVISNNDEMAIGALDALRAHEKQLPLFDALPEALALIKTGEMTGSVLNDSLAQSKVVVKLVANLADGKPATQGTEWEAQKERTIYVPHIGVSQENLSQFLK
ncbi:galactose/glucose ABC transporter substrate-binding protein MglB [Mannheimia sp. AT1]|uniref:D-galactose/methyl-galactoside binding periplasmic protein MglB n=1 Tax=Mannheimia cairinae TaxID=3025936 RepID=A0ABT5MQ37_9PAST|nr:substrate-binding domain-containing protein [Mannheimia cairinae]MDD0824298.1 galactose/glucose ABC transporter substrate-binding protein MglB [Mannheimia cairinae]MDD0826579.1 galactose/glucose ABC transporter substrate-binding protein MglB [Mannheimia cairinae]